MTSALRDPARMERMRQMQVRLEETLSRLAEPEYGFVVVVVEVGHPPGGTLNAMVTFNVAEHSVPDALEQALSSAREQL